MFGRIILYSLALPGRVQVPLNWLLFRVILILLRQGEHDSEDRDIPAALAFYRTMVPFDDILRYGKA